MAAKFITTGIEELDKQLAQLPEKVRQTIVKKNFRNLSARVVRKVKAAAPKRTGRMRKWVHATNLSKKDQKEGKVGRRIVVGGNRYKKEGNVAPYHVFTEVGTVNQSANPFFRNTMHGEQANIQSEIEDGVSQAIDEALRS